jgi:formyltetrahydrofolate-dependent phosphoribosylglycinamide formyltransferase
MEEKRLAVFASGRGSNFKAILDRIADKYIPAKVMLCITNNPQAGVIEVAKAHRIAVKILEPKSFEDGTAFNDAILKELVNARIDYIILAGYLKMIGRNIIERYSNRILNIHPALLPAFGGKGMYGHHVHEAVFQRGVKYSGVTVHLVNEFYDAGPIVLQEPVAIESATSAEEIASRVLQVEHKLFPEAVKLLVEDRLEVNGLRVHTRGDN